ncbi:MAG: hypothetical protein ABSD64_07280 [Terriglobales bacterium]|jgi:hypothetical protein
MILTDSEVAPLKSALNCWELKSALNCWEWFGYISTAIVFVGCVGEFVAEFTPLPKTKEAENKLARLSLIVLILGIAGELLSTVRTSQLSGQLIANIEERAGKAEQRVVEANIRVSENEKEAAQLRQETALIEESLSGRKLTPKDSKTLIDRLTKFRNEQPVILGYNAGDTEARAFTWDMASALHDAKWNLNAPSSIMNIEVAGNPYKGHVTFDTGVAVSYTENRRVAAKALVKALNDCGFNSRLSPSSEPEINGHRIDVFVETRPRGPQGEAKLKLEAMKKKQAQTNQPAN